MKKKFLIYSLLILGINLNYGQEIKPYRIGIIVENLNKSSDWYSDIFNVEIYNELTYPEYDSLKVNLLKNDDLEFELVERKSSFSIRDLKPDYNNKEKPLEGFYKVSFEVDNIQNVYDKLKKKGAEIYFDLSTDQDLKIKSFIIKDLDNNLLQFQENIKD